MLFPTVFKMHAKVSEIIFEKSVKVTNKRKRASEYWGYTGVRNYTGMVTARNK